LLISPAELFDVDVDQLARLLAQRVALNRQHHPAPMKNRRSSLRKRPWHDD
jgi:hypothetical protein